ncbi:MAG: hypothetical protein UU81_C0044G0009 [Microgenomates group bacterium GW2011_GWC1_41_8]|uniref:Uncharacterized protein n=3 Tax=Candidatus Roizmaniibacteriota TaxID=1752723 RepID=A0A0G0XAY9_9BACT|nr:MAG: hypothetical protein UU14_C0008G0025 [Candidatus Roizmanbacteria bacterium GW2011_GWB1_40_7]KKR94281.1 MAG: hypothetical protein UU41_C0009G0027 [Candidatus Roizmanbacteria bacterium GW2011_GWA1_41_13]KKS22099.1 MAG: hypothetical protein UU78_C0023G0025 [Candidatus Roizmanbacteria bacterium GW2011_GWC2_41_7]KKS22973.1 MAG: hypothetical protein UU81_C0044G0009 [Microgenomates group bacterium GW2011_GWC1_41_8]
MGLPSDLVREAGEIKHTQRELKKTDNPSQEQLTALAQRCLSWLEGYPSRGQRKKNIGS